jgi:hypothetical protein
LVEPRSILITAWLGNELLVISSRFVGPPTDVVLVAIALSHAFEVDRTCWLDCGSRYLRDPCCPVGVPVFDLSRQTSCLWLLDTMKKMPLLSERRSCGFAWERH